LNNTHCNIEAPLPFPEVEIKVWQLPLATDSQHGNHSFHPHEHRLVNNSVEHQPEITVVLWVNHKQPWINFSNLPNFKCWLHQEYNETCVLYSCLNVVKVQIITPASCLLSSLEAKSYNKASIMLYSFSSCRWPHVMKNN
jgi:hypothetical protein